MPEHDPQVPAELIKAFAHPTRYLILKELMKGPKCVTDIEDLVPATQANISSSSRCCDSPSSPTMPRMAVCAATTWRGRI
jgi:hypothetical protein